MPLETKLYQRLSQQLVMTPQLRQAIKILQVSRAELETLIDEELAQNPVLEEGAEQVEAEEEMPSRTDTSMETGTNGAEEWTEGPAQRETTTELEPNERMGDIDWKDYFDNYSNDWHEPPVVAAESDDEKRPALENTLVRSTSLTEHLVFQLRMSGLDPVEESVAALIIGNMDKDGYLMIPIEDIAFQSGQDFDVVERVLPVRVPAAANPCPR
jgi:RNA polymerase sigma-54 factor